MAADSQQVETAGAPGSEPSAPSPSQEREFSAPAVSPEREPRGRRAERDARVAELEQVVAAQGARIAELEQKLHRLADALGCADAILPVATPDEIQAAYNAGGKLKVITAIARGTLTLQAGRVIEARHYPIDRLVDLARDGLLRVSIVPSSAKAA